MNSEYSCSYRQVFNCFGAPGIPNEYVATLYWREKNGEWGRVIHRRFWWRRRAEKQCLQWMSMYGARMTHDPIPGSI